MEPFFLKSMKNSWRKCKFKYPASLHLNFRCAEYFKRNKFQNKIKVHNAISRYFLWKTLIIYEKVIKRLNTKKGSFFLTRVALSSKIQTNIHTGLVIPICFLIFSEKRKPWTEISFSRPGRTVRIYFSKFPRTSGNLLLNAGIDVNVYAGCKFTYESDNRHRVHTLPTHARITIWYLQLNYYF